MQYTQKGHVTISPRTLPKRSNEYFESSWRLRKFIHAPLQLDDPKKTLIYPSEIVNYPKSRIMDNLSGNAILQRRFLMMLGLEDGWITSAYLLCLLSSLLCVIYGAINWNKGETAPSAEDQQWAREEAELDEEL